MTLLENRPLAVHHFCEHFQDFQSHEGGTFDEGRAKIAVHDGKHLDEYHIFRLLEDRERSRRNRTVQRAVLSYGASRALDSSV